MKEPNAANPQAPNNNGHIIKIQDRNENIGKTFIWDFFVIADDRADTPEAFGSPDGLWADDDGRIFIQTDGRQPDGMNDQMLVANPFGHMRRLFAGVPGCEVTGIADDAGSAHGCSSTSSIPATATRRSRTSRWPAPADRRSRATPRSPSPERTAASLSGGRRALTRVRPSALVGGRFRGALVGTGGR